MGVTVAVTGPTGEICRPFVSTLDLAPEVDRIGGMALRPFDPAARGWSKIAMSDLVQVGVLLGGGGPT
jgi:UDP-glucose 4-epimerase